jgi:hypothetical protein
LPPSPATNATAGSEEPPVRRLEAAVEKNVRFDPEGSRPLPVVEISIVTEEQPATVALTGAGAWRLPTPRKPQSVRRGEGSWIASFSGWSVVRSVGVTPEPVALQLEGSLADGTRFDASVTVRVVPLE